MGLAEQLGQMLTADAQIAAVIGRRACVHIAQQDAEKPFLLINVLHSEAIGSLQGQTGRTRSVVELDVWADGIDGKVLATRCGLLINRLLCGDVPTSTAPFRGELVAGGIDVDSAVSVRAPQILGHHPADGGDNYVYRHSQDIQIIHSDAED